jgi:hypothetical protein
MLVAAVRQISGHGGISNLDEGIKLSPGLRGKYYA